MGIKNRDEWLNEGHSYDQELENARNFKSSASELQEWAARKIAESRPENFKEGVINPIQEGDMTNKYGGFLITHGPSGTRFKPRYKKGVDSKKREEAAFAKILKDNPKVKPSDLKITGYYEKGGYNDLVQDVPVRLDEDVNEGRAPKAWDTMFAMNVLNAYEKGDIDKDDAKSIEKWDTDYNGGNKPKPSFETKAIIDYAISTGKKPNGDKMSESLNESLALEVAAGIVLGFAGVVTLVKVTKIAANILGTGMLMAGEKLLAKKEAKEAEKRLAKKKSIVEPIVAKFADDKELKKMYADLTPYEDSFAKKAVANNKKRRKEMQAIAKYIKSKLTKDEDIYFTDLSKALRNNGIVESEGLTEASRWKGKEIYPNWVKPSDIEGFVKDKDDLEVGKDYVLFEPGMDSWQAEYTYKGKIKGEYTFSSSAQFSTSPDERFTRRELDSMIKDLELAVMESESVNENKSQEKKIHKWLSDHGIQTPDSVEFDYTFTGDGGMEFDVKIEKGVVTLYDGEEDTTMSYKEFMKDWMNESLNEADDEWSDDVKTKWTPPKGLFTEPAPKIADVLHKDSKDLDQAMSRLMFYINRAGKLLSPKVKAELETAKKLLQQKYA